MGGCNEKNVSTVKTKKKKNPRLYGKEQHRRRTGSAEKQKTEGQMGACSGGVRKVKVGVGVKGRKRILELLRKGFLHESALFKVYCLKNPEGKGCVTAAVSKRTGNAVERNRLRRIIREGIRKELVLPLDIFIRVKKKEINFWAVSAEAKKIKEHISDKKLFDFTDKNL